jgi:hypothetical protein
MNESSKTIMGAPQIDEVIDSILRAKIKERGLLVKALVKRDKTNFHLSSQNNIRIYLDYLIGIEELDSLDKQINSIASAFTHSTSLIETKKNFEKNYLAIKVSLDSIMIEDVVSMYTPVANPRRLVKCPIHEDKTPSLKMYLDTNSFFCFGCRKGGSPVNLVMLVENLTFKEAVNRLLNL